MRPVNAKAPIGTSDRPGNLDRRRRSSPSTRGSSHTSTPAMSASASFTQSALNVYVLGSGSCSSRRLVSAFRLGTRHGVGQTRQGHRDQQAGRDWRRSRSKQRRSTRAFTVLRRRRAMADGADWPPARRLGGIRRSIGLTQQTPFVAGGLAFRLLRTHHQLYEEFQDPHQARICVHKSPRHNAPARRRRMTDPPGRRLRHERFRQDNPGIPGPHDAGALGLGRDQQHGSAFGLRPGGGKFPGSPRAQHPSPDGRPKASDAKWRGSQKLQPKEQTTASQNDDRSA